MTFGDTPPTAPAAQPPQRITVLVAVADDAVRRSLVHALEADGRFEVVGQAADGDDAVGLVREVLPNVAFIDLDLGGGADVVRRSHAESSGTRIVALADNDDDLAYGALAAGAMGSHLRHDPVGRAVDMAAGVARGEGAITQGWAGRMLDEIGWLTREPGPVPAPELTATELEVIRRVAGGSDAVAIAELHGVTGHVVNVHAGIAVTKIRRHHDDLRHADELRRS